MARSPITEPATLLLVYRMTAMHRGALELVTEVTGTSVDRRMPIMCNGELSLDPHNYRVGVDRDAL